MSHSFFSRPTLVVARELLGKELVRRVNGTLLRSTIIETEAYLEHGDPAAHCVKRTPRSEVMFGPPGTIYVYFIYGNYFMLNFVTEPENTAGAVLIRATKPIEGIEKMKELRQKKKVIDAKTLENNLLDGPAKVALAYGIDKNLNGKYLETTGLKLDSGLGVSLGKKILDGDVIRTPRIGISKGQDLLYRFLVKGI
ncbi:MAG: DNA-3-methyladenine glycosylase [Bacteriovoracia bacterium]